MDNNRFNQIINQIQIVSLLVIGSTMLFVSCVGAYKTFYDKDNINAKKTSQKQNKVAFKTFYPDTLHHPAPHDIDCKEMKPTISFSKPCNNIPEVKLEPKQQKTKTKKFITHVTITTYHPIAKECDATPDICASGMKVDHKGLKRGTFKVVAISRDLLCYLPFGSIVNIEGHGNYIVADLMHKRYNHRVDIMIHPEDNKTFMKKNIKLTRIS